MTIVAHTGGAPRFRDAVVAEVTKIITHPATVLALVLTVLLNVCLAVVDTVGVRFFTGGPAGPVRITSFGTVLLMPLYVFLVIPVWAAATEHHGGQLRMSLTAVPRRLRLLSAKTAAMAAVVVLAACIAVVPARILFGVTGGLDTLSILHDCLRWVTVYALMAVLAFGLAGVLRTTIAPLAIMVSVPVVLATGMFQWPNLIRLLPDQASLSFVGTPGYEVTHLPPWASLGLLVTWSVLALVTCAVAFIRRDAR